MPVGIWSSHQGDDTVTAWAGLDVQRDTSPSSAPRPFFSFLMLLSWRVVRICSVVPFLERFGNREMEWTKESVIEFIQTQRQCQPFLNRNDFPECCVLFRDFFSPIKLIKNWNSLGDILVKFLYNPLTDWKFKSASKREPLYTSLLV